MEARVGQAARLVPSIGCFPLLDVATNSSSDGATKSALGSTPPTPCQYQNQHQTQDL